ncbi:MAG TPA: outer membrane lipoprotein carrier protein LolA [Candidatus Eremiobacteraceae bacterium]|nr:outer membrane lipoprotein carrier protein LolA [Candidatus Eremiobacteraceae bacterium]
MRFVLVLLLLSAALSSVVSAGDPLLQRFESQYSSAQTLQATFLERYLDNGRVVQVEAGDAYFLRPGKMRWDYQAPEKNTFLVDGKYVWFYSPADHTATRMPAKQSEDWRTPLALLTSHIKLSKLCSTITPASGVTPNQLDDSVYRCALRGAAAAGASAQAVLFELTPQGELSRIVIPQEGGITIEFSFAGWRWNPPLDNRVFQFTPPPDAVIVDGLLPDTPGLRQ